MKSTIALHPARRLDRRVGVELDDELAGRGRQARVQRLDHAAVLRSISWKSREAAAVAPAAQDLAAAVGGPVVDHHQLEVRRSCELVARRSSTRSRIGALSRLGISSETRGCPGSQAQPLPRRPVGQRALVGQQPAAELPRQRLDRPHHGHDGRVAVARRARRGRSRRRWSTGPSAPVRRGPPAAPTRVLRLATQAPPAPHSACCTTSPRRVVRLVCTTAACSRRSTCHPAAAAGRSGRRPRPRGSARGSRRPARTRSAGTPRSRSWDSPTRRRSRTSAPGSSRRAGGRSGPPRPASAGTGLVHHAAAEQARCARPAVGRSSGPAGRRARWCRRRRTPASRRCRAPPRRCARTRAWARCPAQCTGTAPSPAGSGSGPLSTTSTESPGRRDSADSRSRRSRQRVGGALEGHDHVHARPLHRAQSRAGSLPRERPSS